MIEPKKESKLNKITLAYKIFGGTFLFAILFIAAVNYNFLWLFGGMPSLQELENPKSQEASLLIEIIVVMHTV